MRVVKIQDIDKAVCAALKLPSGVLQEKGRAWAVSHPRMLAVFLARKHTAASYAAISEYFGGKGHSGAVAAEKKVRQGVAANGTLALGERQRPLRDLIEKVERELLR